MVDIDIETPDEKSRFSRLKKLKPRHYIGAAVLLALPFLPLMCGDRDKGIDTSNISSKISSIGAEGSFQGYEHRKVDLESSRWAWYLEDTILKEDLDQFFDVNEFLDVNQLYLGFIHKDSSLNNNDSSYASKYLQDSPEKVREFVRKAHDRGIEALVALPTDFEQTKNPVLSNPKIGTDLMDDIHEFNEEGPGLDGIIFNCELYSHVEGEQAKEKNREFLDLMRTYHDYGKDLDLSVVFTVDSKWNQVLEYDGQTKEFYKHAMDILDEMHVTVYRNFAQGDINGPYDGIIPRASPFFAYASHLDDFHLVVGFETSDFSTSQFKEMYPYDVSRNRISFNVEGKTYDECHDELQEAFRNLDREDVSFSVAYHGIDGSNDFMQDSMLFKKWREKQ
ncbi:MAG: hypothetical protein R6V53_00485 [Candidatus Woesearchaeota archaeon]